jgi:hypothetical protein
MTPFTAAKLVGAGGVVGVNVTALTVEWDANMKTIETKPALRKLGIGNHLLTVI